VIEEIGLMFGFLVGAGAALAGIYWFIRFIWRAIKR